MRLEGTFTPNFRDHNIHHEAGTASLKLLGLDSVHIGRPDDQLTGPCQSYDPFCAK